MGRHPLTAERADAVGVLLRARLADDAAAAPYPVRVEILWWLAPPVVATAVAMLWVSWLGREGRGEVDREVAVRRLGDAMSRPTRIPARTTPRRGAGPDDRSTGVAVRPSSRPGPTRRAS